MSRVAAVLVLALLVPGCILDRSGTLRDEDAAMPPPDSGVADASRQDASPVDGGDDAGVDGGPPDACVPRPELCNGLDDDCDPSTADGSDEPWFGIGCDGDDPDSCAGGVLECPAGAMVCVGDMPGGREELCDGMDNDCNPATPDGADDTRIGMPCDGLDTDRCEDGVYICGLSGLECVGDDVGLPTEVEICDGLDNDCDPATLDGSGDPMVGTLCDDPGDLDLCPEGFWACRTAALFCSGDDGNQPDEAELCDGVDNDCNPATLDGSGDTRVSGPCDGPDSDQCAEGVGSCIGGVFTCSDTTDSNSESCNGNDDDCNGIVDDGGADCPCSRRVLAGHSYLFCNEWTGRRSWTRARDHCRGSGYELATVDDVAEQMWIDANVGEMGAGYWIGANDRGTEGTWVWVDGGGGLAYSNWNGGEPNNAGNEDCALLDPRDTSASGVSGGWNDISCGGNYRYVCEAAP